MTRRSYILQFSTAAILCVFVGLVLVMNGCVRTPIKSPQYKFALFGSDTNAAFQIGFAHRDAIFRHFGKPSYATQHDLAWGYLFAVKTGTAKGLLMGPCMPYIGSTEIWECDDVWLEFDESGILKRVQKHLLAQCHNNTEIAWREFTKAIPDKIRPEQMSDRKP